MKRIPLLVNPVHFVRYNERFHAHRAGLRKKHDPAPDFVKEGAITA